MAIDIKIDTKDIERGIKRLTKLVDAESLKALDQIALEILRLSTFEVPHDTGLLQMSGSKETRGDEVVVGYNKVYASRLHENPQFRFQKGRKGKYLEDPIKNNLSIFRNIYKKVVGRVFI